jgi:hypothetical protein
LNIAKGAIEIDNEEMQIMFEYDQNLSYAPDDRYTEVRIYDLEKLDLSLEKVSEVMAITKTAMEATGFIGSEDYADLIDSFGIVLQYAGNRMLAKVYEDEDGEDFRWPQDKMDDLNGALVCIEQFLLIGKLVK